MRQCPACRSNLETASWDCGTCGFVPSHDGRIPLLAPDAIVAGSGFRPEDFSALAAAEADSFWFNARNDLITWALRSYFPGAQSVLEVGCGTGYVLRALEAAFPAIRTTGCELFPDGLRYAKATLERSELLQADARDLPFTEEFDVVGAFDVLEHIDDDEGALASFYRATRPGGGVLVSVPQHPWLWSPADEHACHERRYTRRELSSKLESAGFTIERLTSFVTLLLPAMAASRRRSRSRPRAYEPSAEHAAAARHGAVLSRAMAAEGWLIRRGVSLPAGGSLFAVARR